MNNREIGSSISSRYVKPVEYGSKSFMGALGDKDVKPLHEFFTDLKQAENKPPKPVEIGRPLQTENISGMFTKNNGKYGKVVHPDNMKPKDRAGLTLRNAVTRSMNTGEFFGQGNQTRAMVEEMFNSLTEPQMIARKGY